MANTIKVFTKAQLTKKRINLAKKIAEKGFGYSRVAYVEEMHRIIGVRSTNLIATPEMHVLIFEEIAKKPNKTTYENILLAKYSRFTEKYNENVFEKYIKYVLKGEGTNLERYKCCYDIIGFMEFIDRKFMYSETKLVFNRAFRNLTNEEKSEANRYILERRNEAPKDYYCEKRYLRKPKKKVHHQLKLELN